MLCSKCLLHDNFGLTLILQTVDSDQKNEIIDTSSKNELPLKDFWALH